MSNRVKVIGVGMVKFSKPGTQEPYEVMAVKAIRSALEDASMGVDEIKQAFASYVYGDSTSGQTALYKVKMTGIPIINVNNNCSSGSTALFLARQAVESGSVDCALAFGFEEMQSGALGSNWHHRISPLDELAQHLNKMIPDGPEAPFALQVFGAAFNSAKES